MDFTSFVTHELIALPKALRFVKFESQEAGASAIVGSPMLGQILDQAAQTLWTKAPQLYPAPHDWPAVTAVPEARAACGPGKRRQNQLIWYRKLVQQSLYS
jgi:hypothetical protein